MTSKKTIHFSPLVLWDSFLWKDNHQVENYWESYSYTFQEVLGDHVHLLCQPCKDLNTSKEKSDSDMKTGYSLVGNNKIMQI